MTFHLRRVILSVGWLFSLVLMFPKVGNEALPPSTVQGKCIYTFSKWRTSRFNFHSYVLNLVNINISFFSFQGLLSRGWFIGLPGLSSTISSADLSAVYAKIVRSSGLIYLPSMLIRQDFWADLSAYSSQRVETKSSVSPSLWVGVSGMCWIQSKLSMMSWSLMVSALVDLSMWM